jgi:hypothetical protein
MKLSPMTARPEPIYPTRCRASTAWRRIAAAAALGVSLLLPSCGDDDATVAVPVTEQPVEVVAPVEEQKPPEPVVEPPEPDVRDPPVRFGGIARSPEL